MSRVQIKFRSLTVYQFIYPILCQFVTISSSLRILVHKVKQDEIKGALNKTEFKMLAMFDGNEPRCEKFIPLKDLNQLRQLNFSLNQFSGEYRNIWFFPDGLE